MSPWVSSSRTYIKQPFRLPCSFNPNTRGMETGGSSWVLHSSQAILISEPQANSRHSKHAKQVLIAPVKELTDNLRGSCRMRRWALVSEAIFPCTASENQGCCQREGKRCRSWPCRADTPGRLKVAQHGTTYSKTPSRSEERKVNSSYHRATDTKIW